MSNETTLLATAATQADFRSALRERILSAFIDLIPQQEFDALLDAEIKAFFETPQLLTVEQTKVEVKNPQYDSSKPTTHWNNEKTLKRDALAFGSQMTPFRQLVWTALHQHLMPIVQVELANDKSQVHTELAMWLSGAGVPQAQAGVQSMLTSLCIGMSQSMFQNAIRTALETSHYNMQTAMQSVGINTNALPTPITVPPRTV